ncbi:hypothetical protein HII31_10460 [Pseudocercospora fuligena]|uniref:Uncharacterized protein n=1 Tax=Pseudocercospora fuligena TaxID=685502 RepID=A0A8H6RA82_9PEZI|nr:hypothetical protein HII31_10460 [Pseudocercospora fuligena]
MVRTRAAAKRDLHPPSDDGTLERANAMASARSPPLAKRYRLRNLPGRKPGSRSSRGALDHEVDGLQVSLTSGDMSAPLASSTQGIDVSPDDSGLSDIPGTVATSRSVESAEPTPLLITRGPRAPPTRGAQGRGVSPDDTNLPVSPGVLSARRLPDSGVLADLRERCRELFDLPQEMVDIIFNFAYPTGYHRRLPHQISHAVDTRHQKEPGSRGNWYL